MGLNTYRQTAVSRTSCGSGRLRPTLCALLLVGLTAVAGCARPAEQQAADSERLRIVSFSPAFSRMLVDLGLEEHIVGRTRYCRFLDDSIAVVGDLYAVDYERLLDLQPTHVLIQASREGADRRLVELCDAQGWELGEWSSVNTIEDIESVLIELPGVLYRQSQTKRQELAQQVATLLNEMALALTPGGADVWTGPVLLVYNTDPIGVFGRETYLHDVLVRLGADNAVEGDGWLQLSLEDLVYLDPPAIVVVMPGADAESELSDHLGPIAAMKINAVQDERVALLTHSDSMYPSTGIIGTAKELREILVRFAAGESPP